MRLRSGLSYQEKEMDVINPKIQVMIDDNDMKIIKFEDSVARIETS